MFVVLTHQQVVLLVETFAFLPVWERQIKTITVKPSLPLTDRREPALVVFESIRLCICVFIPFNPV